MGEIQEERVGNSEILNISCKDTLDATI